MSYSMQLSELLELFSLDLSEQEALIDITALVIDSRKVVLGTLFFAYPGGFKSAALTDLSTPKIS